MSVNNPDTELRELEHLAMNIVYQIGDALYEALPLDVAHKYFVDARQKTNDAAIDFAKRLITTTLEKRVREAAKQAEEIRFADDSWKMRPNLWQNGYTCALSEMRGEINRLAALEPQATEERNP